MPEGDAGGVAGGEPADLRPTAPPAGGAGWAYPGVPGFEAVPSGQTGPTNRPPSHGYAAPWGSAAVYPPTLGAPPGYPQPDVASARAPGPSRSGPKRATVAAIVAVVVAVVAGALAFLVSRSTSPSSSSSQAVARVLEVSLGAARRSGSFHYVSDFTSQGVTQHTVGDAGQNSGRQVITIGAHTFTVLVVGTACYFQGDAEALATQLGLSPSAATAHAGQWISLAPSDAPYATVYAAVTASSALGDNIAFRPQHDLGTVTVGGRPFRSVSGAMKNVTVNGQTEHARGNAEFTAQAFGRHLPVQYAEHGTINGQVTNFVMTFARWGDPVVVVAPPGAVAFSSLGPGSTSGPPGSSTLV